MNGKQTEAWSKKATSHTTIKVTYTDTTCRISIDVDVSNDCISLIFSQGPFDCLDLKLKAWLRMSVAVCQTSA